MRDVFSLFSGGSPEKKRCRVCSPTAARTTGGLFDYWEAREGRAAPLLDSERQLWTSQAVREGASPLVHLLGVAPELSVLIGYRLQCSLVFVLVHAMCTYR